MSFQSAKKASGSSNREAKGFLFLLVILFLPFIAQYTYRGLCYTTRQTALPVTYLSDTCETKKEFMPYNSYGTQASVLPDLNPVKSPSSAVSKNHDHVELNAADSASLETLPGIGPAFASRILKYRSLLGGYVKVEQLKEVYGMPEETYDRIKSLCTINATQVKRISAETLWDAPYKAYHPYLSKELKALINEKKKAGVYSESDLKILIEESNKKLSWYVEW
jgi:competence protein ComEA